MTNPNDLLTSGDAGRVLRLSDERVRQLADAGAIACTRTASGVRLFARADVEYLAGARDAERACSHTSQRVDASACSQCVGVARVKRVKAGVSGSELPKGKRGPTVGRRRK